MTTETLRLATGTVLVQHPEVPPVATLVLLHGAGGDSSHAVRLLRAEAAAAGVVLVAPTSEGRTWDLLLGGFGPDLATIDEAIAALGDATRPLAIGGFSDGASYALSVGLGAGDRYTAIVAFSPGFASPAALVGAPKVFLSHGRGDRVLPVDRCGRRVAAALERSGYDLTYVEFDGGHEIPEPIRRDAVAWLLDATTVLPRDAAG